MNAEEFEAAYAARSGVAIEQLHAWGRYVERCDCGDESCEGWAMGHQWEDAIVEDRQRSVPDGTDSNRTPIPPHSGCPAERQDQERRSGPR